MKRGKIFLNKKSQLKIQALKIPRGILVPSSSRAQLKIQEMAFMLLGVFLFFTLVGLFALTLIYSNVRDEATRIAEERTLSAVSRLADSPELSCVASKSNCIDGDKLIVMTNKTIYGTFWPFSSLKIISYSGFEKNEHELVACSTANYPDCDVFTVYDKKIKNERAIGSFVALCKKKRVQVQESEYIYDHCELAKIIAGTELKNAG